MNRIASSQCNNVPCSFISASQSIKRRERVEVGPQTVGRDVDAPTDRASINSSVRGDDQSFTLPSEENNRAIRSGTAGSAPQAARMNLNLLGQGFKRIRPLNRITRQCLHMADRLTKHL